MKLVVTTIVAMSLSVQAFANVNETLTEHPIIPFVTEQSINMPINDSIETVKIEAVSNDAIAVQIQEIQSQTDMDVDTKITEVESLVTELNTKDDELSNLIQEITTKQLEEKKQAEILTQQKQQADIVALAEKKTSRIQQAKITASKILSRNSPPMVTARKASRRAHARSVGLCAKYVRIALQSAGYRFTPNPSAYMYHTRGTLRKAGFSKISNNVKNQIGDIVVVSRSRAHPHGHMSIYDGKNWISDFRQKRKSPYRKYYSYTTYRDSRYLGNASAKGLYMANR